MQLSEETLKDPIVKMVLQMGYPLTRETYLAMSHPGMDPNDLTAEEEIDLPVEISLHKSDD